MFAPRQPADTVLEHLLEYPAALSSPGAYAPGFAATFRVYNQHPVELQAPLQGELVLGAGVATVFARFALQSRTGQALLCSRAQQPPTETLAPGHRMRCAPTAPSYLIRSSD